MKIVALSDTHRNESSISTSECDLLIHSGDADIFKEKDLIALNNWFCKQPAKYRIFVPGNHDFLFQEDLAFCKNLMPDVTVLVDQEIVIDGITFYGSPWTPQYGDWAFMKRRNSHELWNVWNNIPSYTDVLITHGPPITVLDYVKYAGHQGCEYLKQAVDKIQPKIHIFGHIHEGYGQTSIGWEASCETKSWHQQKRTFFYNAAVLNERYGLVNDPHEIEI